MASGFFRNRNLPCVYIHINTCIFRAFVFPCGIGMNSIFRISVTASVAAAVVVLRISCRYKTNKTKKLCDSHFYCTHFYGPCNINREFLMWMWMCLCVWFALTSFSCILFNGNSYLTHFHHPNKHKHRSTHTLTRHINTYPYLMPLFIRHCLFKVQCNDLMSICFTNICVLYRIVSLRIASHCLCILSFSAPNDIIPISESFVISCGNNSGSKPIYSSWACI